MTAAPALEGSGLACRRGDALLFAGRDFRVAFGEALWVKGPNGSGKTSLLRIVAGLARAAEGTLCWEGETIAELGAAYRARLIYLGHTVPLKDDLTVSESLSEMLAFDGLDYDAAAIEAALAAVGLHARRALATRWLSLGQKRRLLMARLALARRPLWLLDEPAIGLDPDAIAQLESIVSQHLASGGVALFTSHQPLTLAAPVGAFAL